MSSIAVRIPRELADELDRMCAELGITRSEAIRRAIVWRCSQ